MGESDLEVRREDQDKINRFSRLHQKEQTLMDNLGTKTVRWMCAHMSQPLANARSRKIKMIWKRYQGSWNWRMRMTRFRKTPSTLWLWTLL